MAENFLESEIISDKWVDSLNLKVDMAALEEFQKTLKWTQSRGMDAFINRLNTLQALNTKADEIRAWQWNAIVSEAPQVGGVAIPVENRDPTIVAHNEKIRALHQAVQEFNTRRQEFLTSFISRYVNPQPQRVEPRVGERVARRTWPDYFEYMRNQPQTPLTPEEAADAKYAAYLESPEAKKFDAMSDDEIKAILAGFRTQWLGKAVARYEWMPERDMLKRIMFDMKTGTVTGQIEAWLRIVAQYLLKK